MSETKPALEPKIVENKPWITTFTGKHVNPLNIEPEDILIEDVAHQLACQTRWVGASKEPIFTAQHCVFVARYLKNEPPPVQFQGLLHEIPEAYLGDVSKWVKESAMMKTYRAAEEKAWRSACLKFKMQTDIYPAVEEADRALAAIEAFHSMPPNCAVVKQPGYGITPQRLQQAGQFGFWTWQFAEREFMRYFIQLSHAVNLQ